MKYRAFYFVGLATHRLWEPAVGLPAGCRGPRLSQTAQPTGGQRLQGPSAHLPHGRKSDRGEEECNIKEDNRKWK